MCRDDDFLSGNHLRKYAKIFYFEEHRSGKTHFFARIFLVPGRRKTFRSSLLCRAVSLYLAYRAPLRGSMTKVVRVWRMRNRQITDSCTRFTDCTSTGWFGGCSRVDCSHGKSVYVYERKIYRRKIFLFFLRKSLQIPNLFVPLRPEWSILLHVSDETKHSQSHL